MGSSAGAITESLLRLRDGDGGAADEILPAVYGELHRLAHHYLRGQRLGHTLQTTALVHEAYLRLVDQTRAEPVDRVHFVALAARAMRSILVDYARAQKTAKRGGTRQRIPLDDTVALFESRSCDLLSLDDALSRLAAQNERQARIIEMRFFGGLTTAEAARILGLSTRAVEQDWRYARVILKRALSAGDTHSQANSQ